MLMIVKRQQPEIASTAITRAELRESLIELWAQVFERELRAEIEIESAAAAAGGRAVASATAQASRDGETGTLQGGHE